MNIIWAQKKSLYDTYKPLYSLRYAREMSAVKVAHFSGPKKPVQPEVACYVGQPFENVSKSAAAVRSALDQDVRWIVEVVESTYGPNPKPEWSGAMAKSAHGKGNIPGIATQFIFGPLIESPPMILIQF